MMNGVDVMLKHIKLMVKGSCREFLTNALISCVEFDSQVVKLSDYYNPTLLNVLVIQED